ncbi:MAG: DUF1501 domain-containing protein [Verrucomicrobiaceae bacterium]|nr:DUF1501 domain-containing protein [Verrucomicrobiaceae bacterium]
MSAYSKSLTRRRFLGEANCAALSSVPVMNMLLNLKLAGTVAAQTAQPEPTDRKTIVCLFLNGGMDSFNLLVPRDGRHGTYATSRGNLALPLTPQSQKPKDPVISLNQAANGDGQLYGIHPSCTGLAELFNGLGGDTSKRRLAFVSNVGTLIQPATKAQYLAESVPLPRALFSHADQIDQWQTSVPQGMSQASGWAGRAADVLHTNANSGLTSMSISMSGINLFQVGNSTEQFVVTPGGALTFTKAVDGQPASNPLNVKDTAQRSLIQQHYANLMQESFAKLTKNSLDLQEFFQSVFTGPHNPTITTVYPPNNYLATTLKSVARTIFLREWFGLRRQTIFVGYGGWDHHGELLDTQAGMLSTLDGALAAFQKTLEEFGVQDSVITFTASDFGRTLRSNGRGTDHAWGGNAIVMGGAVDGGRVVGTFPDLALDSNNDVGHGGRLLPTTSVDQYFAEMLRWFGVSAANMSYVLPNIANFYNPSSPSLPIGFLKPGTWT